MRKLVGIIFVAIIVVSCAKPPLDCLTLRVLYNPETKYNYSSEQTIETVIKYTGKEKTLQKLRSRGLHNPTIISKKSVIDAIINTGKLEEDDQSYPVKVEYTSVVTNNGEKAAPVIATFHGKCLKDSLPVFDLAVSDRLDRQSKMYLLESWQKAFSQLSFTGQQMKIGEELTVRNPQSIPMEGSEIEMMVTTRYKLTSIKGNIANFNISQQYTLNPKLMDNSFHGQVSGHGSLVYNIDQSMVIVYSLKTEMELTKKLDSFEFNLKTNSGFIQKTSIVSK